MRFTNYTTITYKLKFSERPINCSLIIEIIFFYVPNNNYDALKNRKTYQQWLDIVKISYNLKNRKKMNRIGIFEPEILHKPYIESVN